MKEKLLAALVAAGLTEERANIYAGFINVEKEEQIPGIVAQIKLAEPPDPTQSEIDKRVTQAVQTAISNYEKKHNLKDGKPIINEEEKKKAEEEKRKMEEEKKKGTVNSEQDKEILALKEMIAGLTDAVKGLSEKQKAEQRAEFVKKALTEAKIPEVMHKRFIDNPEATEEEFRLSIDEFRQELADLGIAALKTPGQGSSTDVLEQAAEEAAKHRNNSTTQEGGVRAKEL
jgi:hypothetical protein